MKTLKCRCGHAETYHRKLDNQGFTWCRGDCGCSIFEALHELDPPHQPTTTLLVEINQRELGRVVWDRVLQWMRP